MTFMCFSCALNFTARNKKKKDVIGSIYLKDRHDDTESMLDIFVRM